MIRYTRYQLLKLLTGLDTIINNYRQFSCTRERIVLLQMHITHFCKLQLKRKTMNDDLRGRQCRRGKIFKNT